MAGVPSAAEARALLKALWREGRKFKNYNVREYVKRRSLEGFRELEKVSDPAVVAAAFAHGKQQLEVAKRQALVYSAYVPQVKSVMDLKLSSAT